MFDLDRIVRSYLPSSCAWVVDFKFVFVLIIAAGLGCLIRRIWKPLTYVIFYPVIVLFWKIPFLALKQRSWALAIAFINAVASFFGSIRSNLIIPAVLFAAGSIILFGNSTALISLSTAALLALLLLAYGRRLISIFKTPRLPNLPESCELGTQNSNLFMFAGRGHQGPSVRATFSGTGSEMEAKPCHFIAAKQSVPFRRSKTPVL